MTLGLFDPAFLGGLAAGGGGYDADAQAYITAVEAADGQSLETAVKDAINSFFVGCKADGIFSALKASCILAGARTLSGALVPLVSTMPAPTNFNFVAGDYNRKTGLKGDGSTKYLLSNRNNNADPQNSFHLSVYRTESFSEVAFLIAAGSGSTTGRSAISSFNQGNVPGIFFRLRAAQSTIDGFGGASYTTAGLAAGSRTSATNNDWLVGTASGSFAITSEAPLSANIGVFSNQSGDLPTRCRLSFYSIGESVNLALLDARVSTLMSALAAAIP